MAKQFLDDIIGEDYKRWQPGQRVLACTSTGSGKTWFVLNRLLPYAKAQGKHIVYYCNRKFLNMQVQASAQKLIYDALGEDTDGLAPFLHIRTYQRTEHQRDFPNVLEECENGQKKIISTDEILYYVFDEAMYMVQDASFNRSTQYWHRKSKPIEHAVLVFLTATPEPFYLYLYSYDGLKDLCQKFIARHSVDNGFEYPRWAFFLHKNPFAELRQLKEHLGDPYAILFDWVEQAYDWGASSMDYYYGEDRSLSERYDYADTYYFDELDTLAHVIAQSVQARQRKHKEGNAVHLVEGAWLVFVRKIEDAKSLQLALKTLDCSSVIISAQYTKQFDGAPPKRNNTQKDTFYKLINQEYLGIHVLISTSVLDCGITLRACNVKNLVICQPNKTSFLQMLGRIRVKEGERINLYIQSYTAKNIAAFRNQCRRDFLFLAYFWMINLESPKCYFMHWRQANPINPDPIDYMNFLSDEIRKKLIRELEDNNNFRRFLIDNENKWRRHYDLQSVENLCVNELAVAYYIGQLYFFEKTLPGNTGDRYFFLKEQLSWIGKTYEPERWIDYHEPRACLTQYLSEIFTKYSKNAPMDKNAQDAFKKHCFEYLISLREPPESFLQAKKRHAVGSKDYPGKSKLNAVFTDLGLPFEIKSRQNKSLLKDRETGETIIDPQTGKKKADDQTYWYLDSTDPAERKIALENKRAELRANQESRKVEKKCQEAQKAAPEPEQSCQKKPHKIDVRITKGGKPYVP